MTNDPYVRTLRNNSDPIFASFLISIGRAANNAAAGPVTIAREEESLGLRYLEYILKKPCCADGVEERILLNRLERISERSGLSAEDARTFLDLAVKKEIVIIEDGKGYEGLEGFHLIKREIKGKTIYTRVYGSKCIVR